MGVKPKKSHINDEYSAETLSEDNENALGWKDVRTRLKGGRQRLLITLATAPEVMMMIAFIITLGEIM